ncbi:MAG: integral rane protein TerC, partial [Pseudomonas sp.]|nr:integral rane protein TerC [Pseudomonas sp.]
MAALQTFLFTPVLGTHTWLWLVFIGIVIALLVLDLGVLHRTDREIGMRESLLLYSGYFSVGVLFGMWVWFELGSQSALEFYTGFLVEQSLSMDNVFVMAMIFSYFAIPRRYQHRVLFWGILGVVVLRAVMIGVGAALVQNFSWVLYLFGAFLLITGIRMFFSRQDSHPDLASNPVLRFVRTRMRVTEQIHGAHFFVRLTPPGKTRALRHATPL